MCDEDESKPYALQNREPIQRPLNLPTIIIQHHLWLIPLLPLLNKGPLIPDHILSFMAIDIHPPLPLPVLPIQHTQPSTSSSYRDCGFCTIATQPLDLFLHLLCRHKLNNIFCRYIASLQPLQQIQLDALCKIFINKKGAVCCAVVAFGEFPFVKVHVDPRSNLSGIVCSLPLGLKASSDA